MATFVAHFNVNQGDDEITRHGKLIVYDKPDGKFQVRVDGETKVFDLDKLNTIKYQKWQDASQEEMF